MIKWHLETRKIRDLIPHPRNPRYLSKDQAKHLETSLDKFGLTDRPIVNLDNMIIGGHQRLNIIKKKKQKEIECWIPDRSLSTEEVDELNIRLNKNTGDWDFDILANQWDETLLLEWGFTPQEIQFELPEQIEEEQEEEKPINKKSCPNCGHEF
jgi:ParB-like chromosome segregation protein Spo0J